MAEPPRGWPKRAGAPCGLRCGSPALLRNASETLIITPASTAWGGGTLGDQIRAGPSSRPRGRRPPGRDADTCSGPHLAERDEHGSRLEDGRRHLALPPLAARGLAETVGRHRQGGEALGSRWARVQWPLSGRACVLPVCPSASRSMHVRRLHFLRSHSPTCAQAPQTSCVVRSGVCMVSTH